ncbi:CASC3/Barentsz eIF4AIII binding [Geosmithia morbida]|uniref:CASC3/Barentsz eIF4AIII binding n=1 Tax=Geosmithia morbida TaxID=1094350 RepID=A0A9P4Z1F4_9HYPO|nr:CASC3/Barentsz eIF4AIII binding [Geosmithia morbida]KAF4125664.1 CASC3/Barentsz eIF4AIII binding [Geosmithia morbida]
MAAPRRRKIGHRRRVEDEGEDDTGAEALDLEDDSLTDGSIATDDHGAGNDSDTSNVDEASPTAPSVKKTTNGAPPATAASPTSDATRKASTQHTADKNKAVSDTDMMLHGLSIKDQPARAQELEIDEPPSRPAVTSKSVKSPTAPVVVSSASAAVRDPVEPPESKRRDEHDNYRRRRDEDPAFVPNRGSFFMHDHRHAGPAANGFRPFGRGRGRGGRGGGGGGFGGGHIPPMNQMHRPGDPTTSVPWTHDMHEAVAGPSARRSRQGPTSEGPPNGTGFIPTREPNPSPINRSLSAEKHIANVQVRVFLPHMKAAIVKMGVPVKQYTKLPDHRPPLRRDKPVRISLPDRPPRYIYPAIDRSFIFIPRAMRPNQQRTRGKPRSGLGSVGGMSRRTSVFGGSFYGSMYSPSVGVSRRSSIAHERDMMFSPTDSVMSRSAAPPDHPRPVVRLPPSVGPESIGPGAVMMPDQYPGQDVPGFSAGPHDYQFQPQPQPMHQKPHFRENRSGDLPMHQPRPQKNISVADIESPAMAQGPPQFQQAFHQQVPAPVANGYKNPVHARNPSHLSQPSSGTPLSHIPERAIHAAPFQPHAFGQPQQPQPYYGPGYHQPQPQPQPQAPAGYYYPPPGAAGYSTPGVPPAGPAPTFVPPGAHGAQQQVGQPQGPSGAGGSSGSNLVAQEVNGMVYYYDPAQLPPVNSYQPYPPPQGYPQQPGVMGMGGMVTPSPDGYYYAQGGVPGMVYYPQ